METLLFTNGLPPEIMLNILREVDLQTLVISMRVCRYWNTLIANDSDLQYNIEFALSGLPEPPPQSLPKAKQLAILRDHAHAWQTLEWDHWSSIRVPHLPSYRKRLAGDVLGMSDGHTIRFTRIPSRRLGTAIDHWSIQLDISILDFKMDPAQDLLVLFERPSNAYEPNAVLKVHSRSLRSGVAHPEAQVSPCLASTTFERFGLPRVHFAQIVGDQIGVIYRTDCLVFNWRTGKKRLHIVSNHTSSLAFLDENFILFPFAPLSRSQRPGIVVYDMAEKIIITEATYRCVFELPDGIENVHDVDVFSDSRYISTSSSAVSQREVQVDSVLSISMVYTKLIGDDENGDSDTSEDDEDDRPLIIYVPASRLRKHIKRASSNGSVFAWDAWGLEDTCVDQDSAYPHHTEDLLMSGMRALNLSADSNGHFMVVLDFHPVRIAKAEAESYEDGVFNVMRSSDVNDGYWSATGFRTFLPHLYKRRRIPDELTSMYGNATVWYLTDDAVMAMPQRIENDLEVIHFYMF
ncbi:hypothetical protein DENSPDRAFT_841397 [Dentipellis sp. KUC8613]|nr:hypothetical protein DENSPDRAFT_841397 [Dentipellis sp. KUC8613]